MHPFYYECDYGLMVSKWTDFKVLPITLEVQFFFFCHIGVDMLNNLK